MELFHHGIKGQHWGVRRYQRKDGTRTPLGKERRAYARRAKNAAITDPDVRNILSTLSKTEIEKLGLDDDRSYLTLEQGSLVLKRILKKDGNTPVAFFDLIDSVDEAWAVVATRAGKEYRGKGYGTEVTAEGLKWMERNAKRLGRKRVTWNVRTDNEASIRLAKKNGFEIDKNSYSEDGKWVNYVKPLQ